MIVNYWYNKGVIRVVLGCDIDLNDIEYIIKYVDVEIEVFIYGGMCVGYSGCCLFFNYLINRDVNCGGCVYICCWFFEL